MAVALSTAPSFPRGTDATDPFRFALAVFALLTVLRAVWVLVAPLPLSPEEAQYWDWSRDLDWAYYSKPPLIALVNRVATGLGGVSEASIRMAAVVLSTVATWALARAATAFFASGSPLADRRLAGHALLAACSAPVLFVSGLFGTTDVPMLAGVALWLWAVAPAWRGVRGSHAAQEPRARAAERGMSTGRWVLAGLALALGLQGKYAAAWVLLGWTFAVLWCRPAWRRSRGHLAMLALGLGLGAFPVLFWNARNGWVGVHHVAGLGAGRALGVDARSLRHVLEFCGAQLALVGPVTWIAIGLWRRRERGASAADPAVRLLFLLSLPVLVVLISKGLVTDKLYGNWGAAALPPLVVLGGLAVDRLSRSGRSAQRLRNWMAGTAFGVLGLLFAAAFGLDHARVGADPRSQLLFWDQLGAAVEERLGTRTDRLLVGSYQEAAELAFYCRDRERPLCANLGGRRMNQYDLWNDFDSVAGTPVLWIGRGPRESQPPALLAQTERSESLTLTRGGLETTWSLLWIPALDPRGVDRTADRF